MLNWIGLGVWFENRPGIRERKEELRLDLTSVHLKKPISEKGVLSMINNVQVVICSSEKEVN